VGAKEQRVHGHYQARFTQQADVKIVVNGI